MIASCSPPYDRLMVFCADLGISFRQDEPMARHTSLHIGGAADMALFPSESTVAPLVSFLSGEEIPFVVVGGGTNIVVLDGGIRGAVVFTEGLRRLHVQSRDKGRVSAGAGCRLSELIALSLREGFSGAEGLVGIPGSVGGAVAGNAGSFGIEIKDSLESVTLVHGNGARFTLAQGEIPFGYRCAHLPAHAVILSAEFRFTRDDPGAVREKVTSFIKEKRLRQPITLWSAGCVFKNPRHESAGRLIDQAGCKGMRVGGVEVSRLHANYFINTGEGTADDFLELMERVAVRVAERFGILLEPEVRILGRR